jgi:hypothetical protein
MLTLSTSASATYSSHIVVDRLVVWVPLLGISLMASCSSPPQVQGKGGWPGLPPDCWTEIRTYQTDGDDWNWQSRTRIEGVALGKPEKAVPSLNGVYYFAISEPGTSNSSVLVYSEKSHLTRISFGEAKSIGNVSWINERLLYMRIWWGRVAATDLVFDVEKESVVHAESVHWGQDVFEQYRETCALHGGCQCVKKVSQ